MNPSIEKLLKLQEVDSESFLLEESRRVRPLELEDDRKKVAEARKALEDVAAEIKRLKIESDRGELDVRRADAEIEKYRIALNQTKSNQEYTILKEQIRRQEELRGAAEEEVLGKLTRIDVLEAERKTLAERLAADEENLRRRTAEVAEIVRGIERQLARLAEERKRLAADIDKDHLAIYERILARHRNFALAKVEGQICQGCYISVTTQDVNLLLQGQFVQCRSCSRLLYLESGPRAQERVPSGS